MNGPQLTSIQCRETPEVEHRTRPAWEVLQLAASTAPGDQVIIVHDSVGHGWRNGDFVVIAASGYDSEQSEERQIRVAPALPPKYGVIRV